MSAISLNGSWKMRSATNGDWLDASVPGTVFADLLNAGLVDEPFYRDNEDKIQDVFEKDYEYIREFEVLDEQLASDAITLCCEGIDTISEIYINGRLIVKTDNMHRTYRLDVKGGLIAGTNSIRVVLRSPVAFVRERAQYSKLPNILGNAGVEQIRKAQCAFGWDWGMKLPDMGIWRDIYIECTHVAALADFYITQRHENGKVILRAEADYRVWTDKALAVEFAITSPEKKVITAKGIIDSLNHKCAAEIVIDEPQLWWPNGCGAHPLYTAQALLKDDETVICAKKINIGLRTIVLRRKNDEWGESYEFVINGKALFMMGSNLVIQDSVLTGYSKERTEKMLNSCVEANFNCVRVWGGALYPDDYFYDLCDRLGLVVYQDFMFACNIYPVNEAFLENVKGEVLDNARRIRHHACLGLWSGNNEIEMILRLFTGDDPMFKDIQQQIRQAFDFSGLEDAIEQIIKEYLKLFDETIPDLLKEIDPQTSYVRSSPSGVKLFGNDFDRGDCHYYINYVGMLPYRTQRDHTFRFVSEMGFQSYPSMKTIETFTLPEDRRPDSPIMYKHQKSNNGNQTIEAYMRQDFSIPDDFGLYVYASQILAGEVQKYAIEHMRRNRGRSMGVITWQLNDCWPVVSWAGLDYFGRWKAQQYYSKRFFAPVLVSAAESGSQADIYVTNDTFAQISGVLKWSLKDNDSTTIACGEESVVIEALCAQNCAQLNFSTIVKEFKPASNYLEFTLTAHGAVLGGGTVIFVPAKEFTFLNPRVSVSVEESEKSFMLNVSSKAYAKSVGLDLEQVDCIFSDNYFDLSADAVKVVEVTKTSLSRKLTAEQLKDQLKIVSVYDIV
ncbi:MAG: glycoside hydrolase family 2 protein [Clostridiales bacterium]|jgi:beta-mannosidase|nr:glycoside hydrolase family 2 protein [Clostridiales bacterium]